MSNTRFERFADFYPYYLGEHQNPTCRRLHFVGTNLVIVLIVTVLMTGQWTWLWAFPVVGYGFAWVGHYFFEHNRPATFKHPWYSLLGDFVMTADIWRGKIRL